MRDATSCGTLGGTTRRPRCRRHARPSSRPSSTLGMARRAVRSAALKPHCASRMLVTRGEYCELWGLEKNAGSLGGAAPPRPLRAGRGAAGGGTVSSTLMARTGRSRWPLPRCAASGGKSSPRARALPRRRAVRQGTSDGSSVAGAGVAPTGAKSCSETHQRLRKSASTLQRPGRWTSARKQGNW